MIFFKKNFCYQEGRRPLNPIKIGPMILSVPLHHNRVQDRLSTPPELENISSSNAPSLNIIAIEYQQKSSLKILFKFKNVRLY